MSPRVSGRFSQLSSARPGWLASWSNWPPVPEGLSAGYCRPVLARLTQIHVGTAPHALVARDTLSVLTDTDRLPITTWQDGTVRTLTSEPRAYPGHSHRAAGPEHGSH